MMTELTSLQEGVEAAVRQIIGHADGRLHPATLRDCVRAFTGLYEPETVVSAVERLLASGEIGASVVVSFYDKGPSTDFRLWMVQRERLGAAGELWRERGGREIADKVDA
jgi:hypothetical protein